MLERKLRIIYIQYAETNEKNQTKTANLNFWTFFHVLFLRDSICYNNSFKTCIVDTRYCRTRKYTVSQNSINFASTSFHQPKTIKSKLVRSHIPNIWKYITIYYMDKRLQTPMTGITLTRKICSRTK